MNFGRMESREALKGVEEFFELFSRILQELHAKISKSFLLFKLFVIFLFTGLCRVMGIFPSLRTHVDFIEGSNPKFYFSFSKIEKVDFQLSAYRAS